MERARFWLVSRCDPHGRFTIVYRPDDTGGAAHSCAVGHTTCDKFWPYVIALCSET